MGYYLTWCLTLLLQKPNVVPLVRFRVLGFGFIHFRAQCRHDLWTWRPGAFRLRFFSSEGFGLQALGFQIGVRVWVLGFKDLGSRVVSLMFPALGHSPKR